VFPGQGGPIHLDRLDPPGDAGLRRDPREDPRRGGLAGPRRPGEHHVLSVDAHRKSALAQHTEIEHPFDYRTDLGLGLRQSDECVQGLESARRGLVHQIHSRPFFRSSGPAPRTAIPDA
jgi:hypothetical protein